MHRLASTVPITLITIAFTLSSAFGLTPANHTWVSHGGNDVNLSATPPCNLQQPCATFATAVSGTAINGVISCLDNGSFGPVIPFQSVTIDCGGQGGSIDVGGVAVGVDINKPGISVTLRGLTISGNAGTGSGIRIRDAGTVTIENCVIQGFTGSQGAGIDLVSTNSTALRLSVADSLIANNSDGAVRAGIVISGNGSGPITFAIDRVHIENNASGGIGVVANSTGTVTGVIRDSVVTGSTFEGILANALAAPVTVSLDHTQVAANGTGVFSAGAAVILNNSTVQTNGTGLNANSGGAIFSYGNNAINGNQPGGIGTAPIVIGLH
jgi:hypothetical protein